MLDIDDKNTYLCGYILCSHRARSDGWTALDFMCLASSSTAAALRATDHVALTLPICCSGSIGRRLTVWCLTRDCLSGRNVFEASSVSQIHLQFSSHIIDRRWGPMPQKTGARSSEKASIKTLTMKNIGEFQKKLVYRSCLTFWNQR